MQLPNPKWKHGQVNKEDQQTEKTRHTNFSKTSGNHPNRPIHTTWSIFQDLSYHQGPLNPFICLHGKVFPRHGYLNSLRVHSKSVSLHEGAYVSVSRKFQKCRREESISLPTVKSQPAFLVSISPSLSVSCSYMHWSWNLNSVPWERWRWESDCRTCATFANWGLNLAVIRRGRTPPPLQHPFLSSNLAVVWGGI